MTHSLFSSLIAFVSTQLQSLLYLLLTQSVPYCIVSVIIVSTALYVLLYYYYGSVERMRTNDILPIAFLNIEICPQVLCCMLVAELVVKK